MSYLMRGDRNNGALFIYASANKKLSPIVKVPYIGPARAKFPYRPTPVPPICCSTYVSIDATCPDSCAFKRTPDGFAGGCYVDAGKTVHTIKRLDDEAGTLSGDEVIVAEADLIRAAFRARGSIPRDGWNGGGRALRLHVGGDVSSDGAASFLGEVGDDWIRRGGDSVWTYTHRWREVPREAWGRSIAVLASIERPEQVREARLQGYAPAIVVAKHLTKRSWKHRGTTFIPCPAETHEDVHCVDCRLCLEPDALYRRNAGISFSMHGVDARRSLVKLGILGAQLPFAGMPPAGGRRV